jgi:hypothetical protein
MCVYNQIIALNKLGADAIHRDHDSSLSFFQDALVCARDLLETPHQEDPEAILIPPTMDNASRGHDDEHLAILECAYVQPIYLTCFYGTSAFSQDPIVTMGVTIAIVQFNIGIAHHLSGLQEDNNYLSTAKLSQAQHCYKWVQSILGKIDEHADGYAQSSGYALLDFVNLATFNNLAQISSLLSDHESVQHYFQCLTVYAASVRPEQYDAETAQFLTWLIEAFFSHQILLHIPATASAA